MMQDLMRRFFADCSGATVIEYGLLAALISVAVIGATLELGFEIGVRFSKIADTIRNATSR